MSTYERATELMEAELGDEIVALDERGGMCFGFNGVATTVWRALATPRSFDTLRDLLLDEYEVSPDECETDLRALLNDLTDRGLIRLSS